MTDTLTPPNAPNAWPASGPGTPNPSYAFEPTSTPPDFATASTNV